MANNVFGIDLGTTYSCIAYVDEYNRPTVALNAAGDRTTPSVVQFDGTNRIVGKEAKNSSILYPNTTVEMVKRYMGHASEFLFEYEGTNYKPEVISSYILRKVVDDAEQYTGQKITDVVITCPAYFGIAEREATARAGEIAGLTVRSIINEPTAAAIAYGINQENDQVILVYDLGGGTFDITMIEIKGGSLTVICTGGNHQLGGRNWDEIIALYLAQQWQAENGSTDDPLDNPETRQDLYLRAEAAKQALSNPQRAKTDVSVTHDGKRARVALTLEKFDELTSPLLERTIELSKDMLKEAERKGHTRFDQLLLVGGSTRMRQVERRLKEVFAIEPKSFEPDEAVAKGAAIFGQKLMLDQEIVIRIAEQTGLSEEEAKQQVDQGTVSPQMMDNVTREVAQDFNLQIGAVKKAAETTITNVTSRSFGIVAYDMTESRDIVFNLIRKNDALPAHAVQQFGTREAHQENALLQIMENIAPELKWAIDKSTPIGDAEISLPPGLPINTPIEVTFDLDEQGRLHASGRDLKTGREATVTIQTTEGMSTQELEQEKVRTKSLSFSS